jgi:osmotically-inducible protein OsmY
MADYNRNQDNQFDQSGGGWEQNRRRFDQESDYNRNRENYGSFGNVGMSDEWNRPGSYSGASSGYGSQQGRRGMSDYEERRGSYGRGDSARGREMENLGGYGQTGSDYGREYRSSGGAMGSSYGRSDMGRREGSQDWQRSRYGGGYGRDERQGYGGEYGEASDYRRGWETTGNYGEMGGRNMGSMGGRTYGEIYGGNLEERERMTNMARGGRENIMANRGGVERMYGGTREEDYMGTGRYSGDYGRGNYGQMSGGYGEMGRGSRMGDYGTSRERRDREDRDYGRMERDRDRSWWDKTRDEVTSWFGDDEAERRRIMDERRSESYRGKGPRDYKRSDERIREDVCDRLSDDPFIDASDVEVRVEGSEVVLSGVVHSREEKRRAEDMVESISGVSNVQNQLKVSRDTSSTTEANR